MRRWLLRALGALALLLLLDGFWIEPSRLVERTVDLQVEGLPPCTVALLSDVHAGSHFVDRARLRDVVARLNRWQPDVVALLGDFMTEGSFATPIPPDVTARLLGDLRAPGGVFAVLGNHDWWHDGEEVGSALTGAQIRVLDGQTHTTQVRGRPLRVVGLPDLMTRREQAHAAIAHFPPDAPALVLSHTPDVFPELPASARLTLAGHTHGGQVRLPLLGALLVPSRYGQRYAAGHAFEQGHHLFVTTGLGTSVLPVRLGVPPEIVLLRLNGAR